MRFYLLFVFISVFGNVRGQVEGLEQVCNPGKSINTITQRLFDCGDVEEESCVKKCWWYDTTCAESPAGDIDDGSRAYFAGIRLHQTQGEEAQPQVYCCLSSAKTFSSDCSWVPGDSVPDGMTAVDARFTGEGAQRTLQLKACPVAQEFSPCDPDSIADPDVGRLLAGLGVGLGTGLGVGLGVGLGTGLGVANALATTTVAAGRK